MGRWLVTAALAVALVAPPASAKGAPEGKGRLPKATYTNVDAWGHDTCAEGATCTHEATADGSGLQHAAATIDRSDLTKVDEFSYGIAYAGTVVKVGQGVRELEVKFTWHVEQASASATPASGEGATVARTFARGRVVGCLKCEVKHATDDDATANEKGRYVVSAYAVGAPREDTLENADVWHTMTLSMPDGSFLPVGRYTLIGHTLAYTAVAPVCDAKDPVLTTLFGKKGCVPEASGHAGSAATAADLQLTGITYTTTA